MREKGKTEIDFNKLGGVVPVVAQEAGSKDVLMVAFMNEDAWMRTVETGTMWYFSRKRNKLWMKGEQSGHVQKVLALYLDCDNDTILAEVEQVGGACDLGYRSCFDRRWRDGIFEQCSSRVFDPANVYPYETELRIGIPTGSLSSCTLDILRAALPSIMADGDDEYRSALPSRTAAAAFSSHDSREIAMLVASGDLDAGITGFDLIVEAQQRVVPVDLFGYNKRGRGPAIWAVAVPVQSPVQKPSELEGQRIITEVPNLTTKFLRRNGIRAEVQVRKGDHRQLFNGQPVVELIETGTTIREFGYRPLCPILWTYATLVANPESYGYSWKRRGIEELSAELVGAESGVAQCDKRAYEFDRSELRRVRLAESWDGFRAGWFNRYAEQAEGAK